jgi:hypothetical protein
VTATFSEAVQGVSGATFTLRAAGSTTDVPATVTYANGVATLDPTANLAANTQYTATLTGGTTAIRDGANNALATTSWSFTTAAAGDTVAPFVSTRIPGSTATGVAVGNNVSAIFSENVQGVSGTTFTLRTGSTTGTGTAVAAVVSYDAATRTATLNPNANLAANTQYTATVTGGATGIRDTANNPLTTASWSFTTGASTGGTRTLTLDPVADATVSQSAATSNFGTTATLAADTEVTTGNVNTRSGSYLRYNIPALATGETITAASLSVNVTNATTNGPAIFRTGTTWTETTMTWNTGRPTRSSTTAVGNFANMALGRVSTPLSGITAAGLVSFELFAESTDGMDVGSRESTTRPQLVVTIRTP